ncbi:MULTISPECIES: PPOX class F420-dependent oxidoreductase [Thermomicrobium]|uniref:Pyridoxamine 5'-phosphate oxidase-related, FMN-binding n=1 Tax=Thermomicrobium roseum (strain ATCC 27502 / DSM 5159 / P-2) TaxID=309801 RepID=B9L435_THERP|nr:MULTISPECIES: PPOX class F420-dependent oxidoreductase [Thermomicrobium]ACM06844.1 pyridoxamine 5'-phosphate oxidase-related, FMN-binding [Thermomicrobium roseum DSM 5159]MBO9306898.1 PPOX class F420-dependent oxidoreductase [Thermomicrobium sp.]MBO9352037.1 PPOX class F420-dependent oxidoreductase [Thermomicrobium sp.]MBO9386605.1 PPOX class F420-dependent oxidoreductase [Thermomicrobium sp.]MBO9405726.1 PPOX class F420-dependent oxidoreductase [Thermomicrobium sp.]
MAVIPEYLRDFLLAPRFAVLATIAPDGLPRQSVMWYDVLDQETILMNTAVGRAKLDDLRRDPRASLCIADGYRYVTVIGRVELIEDQERAQADIARLAVRYVGEEEARSWIPQFRAQRRVTLLLRIERVLAHGFAGA